MEDGGDEYGAQVSDGWSRKTSAAMTGASRLSRTSLLLWAVGPVLELSAVAAATAVFPEVAEASVFGSPWTEVVLIGALCATLVGVLMARRSSGPSSGRRWGVAAVLWILAGVVALVTTWFFMSGRWLVYGVLLAHSAVSMFVIAQQVTRAPVNEHPSAVASR
ncbi:hypothetical protein [Micromonospora sp. KC213]|uniref:hypothetical protein n=1 Tax=Micromonospora sp. KC213 TaxID=2530378 RepID=UPI00104B5323|nr:hypothetical protein [Micromonospora sp. KC213]TDC43819.1 hypothetical protein E1166_02150 [Micromonospora sp. KC213]